MSSIYKGEVLLFKINLLFADSGFIKVFEVEINFFI
jgi:hypothetical protein